MKYKESTVKKKDPDKTQTIPQNMNNEANIPDLKTPNSCRICGNEANLM